MSTAQDLQHLVPLPVVSVPLPWQQATWQQWVDAVATDRLAHALLLCGQPGNGRQRLALALARYLLCAAPRAGSNCGSCKACVLSAGWGHSDFRLLSPQGKSLSIGVDAVRDLIGFAGQTSVLGARKVAVVLDAERMTTAAANALLKILEEPPAATFFLLVARSAHAVPATVRSRAQLVSCAQPEAELATQWLAMDGVPLTECHTALELAGGRPLAAQALLLEGKLAPLAKRRADIHCWLSGEPCPAGLLSELGSLPAGKLLETLYQGIADWLRVLPAQHLRSPRNQRLLELAAQLCQLQRAVSGGATPQPELLLGSLRARLDSLDC